MNTTACKLLDSSAWIEYFEGNPILTKIVDGQTIILVSSISLLEIKRKLLKEKIADEKIVRILEFMQRRAQVVEVSSEIAIQAAVFSHSNALHAIDAIIYASAQHHKAILLTGDNDFRNLQGVEFVK